MRKICFLTAALILYSVTLFAAVGCDLNDPDRDVRRLFPSSTGFKTVYVSIAEKGGDELLTKIEDRLGDKFKGLYETKDVPYTIYEIFQGKNKIGYIHGVNQKGTYGGIQVFLAFDVNGEIKGFYIQKLTSNKASLFRKELFGAQFLGLSLKEFYAYNVAEARFKVMAGAPAIKNPDPSSDADFRSIMRGVKKNLILMDEFMLDNKYLRFHKSGGRI